MGRRLTRREIVQKDEFLSGLEHLAVWLEKRWKTLLVVVGGAVGAALIAGLVSMWLTAQGADAARLLGSALTTLQAPILATGQLVSATGQVGYTTAEERDQAALEALDAVLESHPMSRAATLAAYMRGATLLRLDRAEEAREALLSFTREYARSPLIPLARRALARAEMAAGHPEETLRILQDLVEAPTLVFPIDAALMELARAQEEAGRAEEAAETFRRVANEFPESVYSGEAGQAFARLSIAGTVPSA